MRSVVRSLPAALAAACALLAALPAAAQDAGGDARCILVGRIGADGWAPRLPGVELLGADGRDIAATTRQALAGVRQVRLSEPALLSRCDGNRTLAEGPDAPGPKSQVPAIGAGVWPVQAVNHPRLPRGGELVEVQVAVPPERVTLTTR